MEHQLRIRRKNAMIEAFRVLASDYPTVSKVKMIAYLKRTNRLDDGIAFDQSHTSTDVDFGTFEVIGPAPILPSIVKSNEPSYTFTQLAFIYDTA